ncbi:cytochrome P450 [Streptomyces sp. NPDC059255]|uniref:cytochrome P450 n=1 Tax=Streptomyces sp. NPDC059255 TaxID=3346793 RepID=UPI0036A316FD
MTTKPPSTSQSAATPPAATWAGAGAVPVPLWGDDFNTDPYAIYARLRRFGAVAPVEIHPGVNAWLVIDYQAALEVLRDTATYSHNPLSWSDPVPSDHPIAPVIQPRPCAIATDGAEHQRYRQVITDGFNMIPSHELRDRVTRLADDLIRDFAEAGEVDLVAQYARQLPLVVFNDLFGLPASYATGLSRTMARLMEGGDEAADANEELEAYLAELIAMKTEHRGADLTSWYLDHPNGMTQEEMAHQLLLTLVAGNEPTTNLISNALSRMLSDPSYYSTLTNGARTAREAVEDVLREEPPMSNYSYHFPRRDVLLHGNWIRTGELILISYAAANTTPDGLPPGPRTDGGSHLAWSAGPHQCPVKHSALLLAVTAIERLTSWLSDLELTVPRAKLQWRPGVIHRALAELPARFTPITPGRAGATPWNRQSPQEASVAYTESSP